MLEELKWKALQELVKNSSKEELIWINGYLTGFLGQSGGPQAGGAVPKVSRFTLAYGTETGNAKKLATQFAAEAKKQGFQVKLAGLDQYRLNDLVKEEYFFLVVSTQGDGEPPASALKFYEYLREEGKSHDKLKFAVLGLGDTSYPLFCQAGVDVDTLLEKRGGTRLLPLVKCDTDYDAPAAEWFASVLKSLSSAAGSAVQAAPVPGKPTTGKKQYKGIVVGNINLNDTPSNKETHHIEISVDDDLAYESGDAAGFIPYNEPEQVEHVLHALGVDGSGEVTFRQETGTLRDLLTRRVSLVYLPERVIKKYMELAGKEIPEERADLARLLEEYPLRHSVTAQQLLDILEPIAPRLYSIASSPATHSGELHLTVARNTYKQGEQLRDGLCSRYLNHLPVDSEVEFYIHPNRSFRLPSPESDVIMVGPGTGIAPFRSFLAERDSTGASGRNWLFFGEQHFVTDFLYQTELQNFLEMGVLSKLDLAFSRDQKEKIYVQHRMLENGAELYDWLQNGASLYVCGTRDPMSVDVEHALVEILREHGKLSEEAAQQYLEQLVTENRYLKDVY